MRPEELEALSDWFASFVALFRAETPEEQRNYDLKLEHTWRVRANAAYLAAALGWAPAEQRLAEALAICHDVGRFPQFRDYATFNDGVSCDHAALSVRTLRAEGVLAPLEAGERRMLLQATALHNRFALPASLPEHLRRCAQLLRDADKLDIWRVLVEYRQAPAADQPSAVLWGLPATGCCSVEAVAAVARGELLHRDLVKTVDDFTLLQLSWVFDLNFAASFALLAERRYVETLLALLPEQSGCNEVAERVRAHIDRQ